MLAGPVHERLHAFGPDVHVEAVELGRARDAEPVAQPAGDDLGGFVEQAHAGRGGAACLVVQVHADGIAFDRVDVERVAQPLGELPAGGPGADDDGVGGFALARPRAAFARDVQQVGAPLVDDVLDVGVQHEAHAPAFAGARQAAREFVDVAGGVRRRVEAAMAGRLQGGLDAARFGGGHRVAFQPAFLQQRVGAARGLETGGVVVDVQDAAALQVEVDAFLFGHRVQMLARFDGQARGVDGVLAVVADLPDELRQPGILVPAEPGVEQQGCVVAPEPAQALRDGGHAVPDLGVAGR
ncbi:hypothetical protein D9M68_609180 [compost metagenome]